MKINKKFKHEQKRKAHRLDIAKKELGIKIRAKRSRLEIIKARREQLKRHREADNYVAKLEQEIEA